MSQSTHSTTTTVATASGSRYLQQLAKHWAHKFTVDFDQTQARIVNENGNGVTMAATADSLAITAFSADAETLPKWRQVVEDHIVRFAFRETLEFDWQAA